VTQGNRGVHGIPLMPVRRGASAETAKPRACSRLGEQFGARHKRDVSVEDRLGDAEKAGYDRGIIVKIHRRLAGEAFVGRKNTGVRGILRDEKANGGRFIRASVLGHFEQSLAQSVVMAVLGANDRGNGQHRSSFQSTGSVREFRHAADKGVRSPGFAETRDFRVM
jgi:hypothetical protein